MSIKKERDIPSLSVYSDSLAKTCAQVIQKVQVLQCLIFSIAFFFEFPGTLYAGDLPEVQAHDRISRADKKHLFRAFHKSPVFHCSSRCRAWTCKGGLIEQAVPRS